MPLPTPAAGQIPQARICLDPFPVIKWTNEVVESVYRAEAPTMPSGPGMPERRDWRRARFAVRAGRENLDDQHRQILSLLRRHRYRLWRTPSNSACPTPASKASTPRSGSSNDAATATATSTPSPQPSTSASAESPSTYPRKSK